MKGFRTYLLMAVLLWGVLDLPIFNGSPGSNPAVSDGIHAFRSLADVKAASANRDIDDTFCFHAQPLPCPQQVLVFTFVAARIMVSAGRVPEVLLAAPLVKPLRT